MPNLRPARGKRARVDATEHQPEASEGSSARSSRNSKHSSKKHIPSQQVSSPAETYHEVCCLDRLPQMPIDVLYETFGHLTPEDLLQLTRSSKALRRLLLSSSSGVVWRQARKNVKDLPNCPPYLSEPKYASLIFDVHCYNCGLRDGSETDVIWAFNVRYCKACKRAMFKFKRLTDPGIHEIMILPHTSGPTRKGIASYYFHLPDLLRYDVMSNAQDEDLMEAYTLSQAEVTSQIIETTPILVKYTDATRRRRQQQERAAKSKRITAISERLKDDGFEEQWACLVNQREEWLRFSRHHLVGITEPLTDEGWVNIATEIRQIIQQFWERHQLDQYKNTLLGRFEMFKGMVTQWPTYANFHIHCGKVVCAPSFVDICLLPEVRSVIGVSYAEKVEADDLLRLCGMGAKLAQNWLANVQAQFTAHIASQLDDKLNEDLHQLAIAYVRCKRCGGMDRYPDILTHECCLTTQSQVMDHSAYEESACIVGNKFPWSSDCLEWCPWADKFGQVFKLCGLNPMSATLSEVKDAKMKMQCTLCLARRRKKALSCFEALDHCMHYHVRHNADETGWESAESQVEVVD